LGERKIEAAGDSGPDWIAHPKTATAITTAPFL
jgi:hypothetical protein